MDLDLFLFLLGLFVGGILALTFGLLLYANHVTRIIGAIIGAAHYYLFHHLGVAVGIYFIDGIMMGFYILDLFAAYLAIGEVFCLIAFLLELIGIDISTTSKPSPYSHAMGELANLIMLFFR